MTRPLALTAVLLVTAATWPAAAAAQRVEHGRGNIVSIDANSGTLELRDPQGRVGQWRFNRGASVRFTDGRNFFPNPSVADLRPPMYVHFTFQDEVIQSFDVVELGFDPSSADSGSATKQQGVSRTVTGRVTAYDPAVRQVEVDHNGQRETFQLTDRSDQRFEAGDRITLRTDWSGQRELVVDARRNDRNSGDRSPNTNAAGSRSGRFGVGTRDTTRGTSADSNTAEGRVVRISSRGVVMEVAGGQQNYGIDDRQLLRQLRVGDTVQFTWREDSKGRLFITNIR